MPSPGLGRRTWQVRLLDGALGNCLFSLRHGLGEIAFPASERVGIQSGFDRIATDVAEDVAEVVAIANEAIKVVVLPKLAVKPEFLMDHACGASFPGEQHFLQQPIGVQHHEHMNVIRHDDIREQLVALLIEVLQRLDHCLADFRLAQDTGAVSFVQPLVDAGGEQPVKLGFEQDHCGVLSNLQTVLSELESAVTAAGGSRKAVMLRRFTDQFLANQHILAEEHVRAYDEVIFNLARDIEFRARVELSGRLAKVENAPYKTVRDLAFDDDHAVAGPVITFSPRLSEADLVEIAREKGQDHLMALSNRRNLTEMVTDILIDRGELPVQTNVAGNATAKLSPGGIAKLANIAVDDEGMRKAMASRHDIPALLMEKIVEKARAAAVRQIALELGPSGQAAAESLVKSGIESIERAGRTFSLLGDTAKSEQLAMQMVREGGAGEGRVVAMLNAGDLADGAALLAQMARLPIANVVSALSAARIDPLLIVLKLAGFSWLGVQDVLSHKSGGVVPAKLLAEAKRSYEDLSRSNAERALRLIAIKRTTAH